jgi:RND superfamily putative drug exporter
LALAIPATTLKLDFRNISALPRNDPMTVALRNISWRWGAGAVGPVEVVTKAPERATSILRNEPHESSIFRTVEGDHGWWLIEPILNVAPDSNAAHETIGDLRHRLRGLGGATYVGGQSASEIDLTDRVSSRTPTVVAIAVVICAAMLAIGLQSIIIPIKAVLCSLLSVAATMGVLVVLFPSSGTGSSLTFFVPLFIFILVFGLSTDYEVLFLSRVRQAVNEGHSTTESVSIGLTQSARSITLAGLAVATVFAAFSASSLAAFRQLGIGLAVAVGLDVSVVRCVMVPAFVVLLGRINWWFPNRMAQLAPKTSQSRWHRR